ncbi:hypothetical protein GCM10020227_53920 [Streptomyces flavovirens]
MQPLTAVITATQPAWATPFTGPSPRRFSKLVTMLRREGADAVRRGRPWSLPLEDRVIDADTHLVVVVGRPLAANRNDCKA